MGRINNEEFKCDAVHIALTSGLKRPQVAADLKVGHSPLAKWIQRSRREDLPPKADVDLGREFERLRKEEPFAAGGEGSAKKSNCFLRGEKQVRFAFVKEYQTMIPTDRLCRMLGVSTCR